jgi:hypothetical protein
MSVRFNGRVLIAAFKNTKPTWLPLAGLIVSFFIGWFFSSTTSAGVRYAGATLQILGLATVASGLSEMRRYFGRPSLREKFCGWLKQIAAVFKRPQTATYDDGLSLGGTTYGGSGSERFIYSAGPEASLEERISVLEKNLDRLRDEFEGEVKPLRQDVGGLRRDIKSEIQARRAEHQEMEKKIEQVAVGGLHLEYIGVVWLFFGILASSIPDELAAFYEWLQTAVRCVSWQ